MSEEIIEFPTARFTLEYGLADDGRPILSALWENLADPDTTVSMITRAGMLAMAQQSLTGESFGLMEDDDAE